MGRYAFFNTGFEYKFRFAVQPSEDMLAFGGTPTFVYEGDPKHDWTIVDRKKIEGILRDLEDALELPNLNFELYSKDVEGTSDLRLDFYSSEKSDEMLFCKYVLGCLIYHQLLYRLDLSCTYEP